MSDAFHCVPFLAEPLGVGRSGMRPYQSEMGTGRTVRPLYCCKKRLER
jgi:hypothetical protein